MAARRSGRASEAAPRRPRRVGRRTPLRPPGRARRRGPRGAEGGGTAGHAPVRSLSGHSLDVRGGVRRASLASSRAAGRGRRRGGGEARMSVMNMIQALNSAHKVMMARDPATVVLGEDVGYFGGVFRVTEGLQREYGKQRCFDSPISENGIVAVAIGMAAYGLKPVAEIQFADYIYPGFDQIVSEAAKMRYRSAGEWHLPMVLRTPYGGGIFGGQTHSQSPEALFAHIAGIKTVIPSNPYDAKGLLIAAIEDDDPVVIFEPKRLYNGPFDGNPDNPVTPWQKIEGNDV